MKRGLSFTTLPKYFIKKCRFCSWNNIKKVYLTRTIIHQSSKYCSEIKYPLQLITKCKNEGVGRFWFLTKTIKLLSHIRWTWSTSLTAQRLLILPVVFNSTWYLKVLHMNLMITRKWNKSSFCFSILLKIVLSSCFTFSRTSFFVFLVLL